MAIKSKNNIKLFKNTTYAVHKLGKETYRGNRPERKGRYPRSEESV